MPEWFVWSTLESSESIGIYKNPLTSAMHVLKWHNVCDNNLKYSYYCHWKCTVNVHLWVLHLAVWQKKKKRYYKGGNEKTGTKYSGDGANKKTNKQTKALLLCDAFHPHHSSFGSWLENYAGLKPQLVRLDILCKKYRYSRREKGV